ncbi:MAG: glutamate 5-kinase [Alphaproteobacteria bacterium]
MNTQDVLRNAQSVVIKVGTALLVRMDAGGVKHEWLDAFAEDVKALTQQGKQVVIISSGAVAMGRSALNIPLDAAPRDIPLEKKQAASAVGQFHIFNAYFDSFSRHGLTLAQVLLTMSETENRRMHLNARATLNELMAYGIIPVINENDTISTGEIRFGDNDRLAARVAQMIGADAVILLSTTDGLYTANPDKDKAAQHIPVIETITDEHHKMAGEAIPGMSTGGMKSKVEAARAAVAAGIHLIVADGRPSHALEALYESKSARTSLFLAGDNKKSAKKRWIGSHLAPKGVVIVDNGALSALNAGKSLLPVGVHKVEGTFERGDIVEIYSMERRKLGMGVIAYASEDAQKLVGKNSAEIADILGYAGRSELIHRNDMVFNS